MATRKRWLGRLGAAVLLSGAALGVFAAPASAHNYEVSSTPEAGAVVTTQPDVISVTTNDDLLAVDGLNGGMGIQVSGPAEHPLYYGDGCVTVFGPTIEAEAALGQPGEYTVSWQVISTDGHSVSDSFTFTWKPNADQKLAAGKSAPPTCGKTATDAAGEGTATAAPDGSGDAGGAATSGDAAKAALVDVVWIGGAVLVVLVAVVVTLVLVRRKPAVPRE
ncbi:copper resistance CopC family protein [Cryobacterium tepidiphilum]|uniref:Copper resistance protein CopC n=1 Tax=Cryobacterium tepidiphilum TaxID=2486026 RepID=A0A3M8LR51_9MICO|nr:copper resistance CopC family protein [Cryobacterium tepidiphilum]RNE67359.1 copper resistance protein CopC [Cryobacterium tepidiphilum]